MGRSVFSLFWPFVAAVALMVTIMSPAEAKSPVPKGNGPVNGKVFDDWIVICEKQPDGKTEKCFAQQTQSAKDGGQRVLSVIFGYIGPKSEPVMITVLPLGINLQVGAAYKLDEQAQIPLQLQQCSTGGCNAAVTLTESQLKAIVGGKSLVVGMIPWGNPQTLSIPVSLKGLSDALAASR